MMLLVLRTLNACVWIFVLWLWSDQSEFMVLFMVFNLWMVPGFIFQSVINFLFFSSYIPVTAHGLDLF